MRKLRPFIKGITAGIITAAVLAIVSAVIFVIAGAPDGTDEILGYITVGGACFVCGVFIGAGRGKNGFLWGTVGGGILFVLCCAGAVITGNLSGAAFVGKLIVCLFGGCIGGIIGVNKFSESS